MIKTLLIDDNKIIREYFQKMVDWASLGFELTAVCANGIAGWQEFQNRRPQLVITDVHMPGLTGLELTKRIRETAPDTVVVFISNYEDFSYVKGAMELGVYDYILKHDARGDKLEKTLIKIREHIMRTSQNRRTFIEGRLLMSIISGNASQLERSFPDRYDCVVFEQASVLPPFLKYGHQDVNEVDDSRWQAVFGKFEQVLCSVKLAKYRYGVLLKPGRGMVSFADGAAAAIYDAERVQCFGLPLLESGTITECISAFREKINLIGRKYFYRHKNVITWGASIQRNDTLYRPDYREMRDALADGDIDRLCAIIDETERSISENQDVAALNEFTEQSLEILTKFAEEHPYTGFTLFGDRDCRFWTSAEEVFFWLKNKFIQLAGRAGEDTYRSYSEPVKRAIEYISANYSNSDLTIADITQQAGIGVNQLNKLMKAETGRTAIKWLTNTRMEKARELLRGGGKLGQIYSQVGYANNSYFANVFKKNCGMTPLEYRRNAREESSKI